MERYWDRCAREDPFYYVDDRQRFRHTDFDAFWHDGAQDLAEILELLDVRLTSEEDVVEIGCGIGRLTRVLASSARSVHAIDISREMLSRARTHNPDLSNVHWIHGDGESLDPLPDGAFDACVSHVVFQHIPNPQITLGYIREIGRVLRAGGWAAFQISNDPRIHTATGASARLRDRLRARTGRGPRRSDPAWVGSAVRLEDLERAANDGRLDLERIENAGTQHCIVLARRRPTRTASAAVPRGLRR